jgi:hypothetical protein
MKNPKASREMSQKCHCDFLGRGFYFTELFCVLKILWEKLYFWEAKNTGMCQQKIVLRKFAHFYDVLIA